MTRQRSFRTAPGPLALLAALLAGCAGPTYSYRYIPGRTAELRKGLAIAPSAAPAQVHAAVAAGNRIAGSPYAYGGGHRPGMATAYDCSGATSYVLQRAGLLGSPMPSTGFRRYGDAGPGEWITLYARRDHVFLVIAGLRFDTGWTGLKKSPQWTTHSRPTAGSVRRHPQGL